MEQSGFHHPAFLILITIYIEISKAFSCAVIKSGNNSIDHDRQLLSHQINSLSI